MINVIFWVVGISITLTLTFFLIQRLRYEEEINRIWLSLSTPPAQEIFTADMVAKLPPPVRRYFLHAIAPGTPLANSVTLVMNGSFRTETSQQWLPMQAKELICACQGFIWKAKIGHRWLQLIGEDYYTRTKGQICFAWWGIIPFIKMESPHINRSAIGRLAGELVWLPSALLPQQGVSWQAINNNKIQASFNLDGEPIELTLVIAPDGTLKQMSLPRWGEHLNRGDWGYIAFGGESYGEKTFDGFTIPSQMIAGWHFGSKDYHEFFRVLIKQAEFS